MPVPLDDHGGLFAGLLVEFGNEVLAAESQGVRDQRVLLIALRVKCGVLAFLQGCPVGDLVRDYR
ncbi:hypothetical protein [Pseudonocardia sp. ICBG1034]|uniref:hypothetical protein n=1 Tax=Pseudonocardia sp. ICBG1034 TaxID=2844381 RepID=UPI001CD0093E|nr:hypothetical protein [Pseudonocardia sp. ICBG1034]